LFFCLYQANQNRAELPAQIRVIELIGNELNPLNLDSAKSSLFLRVEVLVFLMWGTSICSTRNEYSGTQNQTQFSWGFSRNLRRKAID
jgi:hypothetical protein